MVNWAAEGLAAISIIEESPQTVSTLNDAVIETVYANLDEIIGALADDEKQIASDRADTILGYS